VNELFQESFQICRPRRANTAVRASASPPSQPIKNNKRDKLAVNAGESVGVYFRPKAPEGKEWTQTVPNNGWYTLLRLQGPLEPWFDKTWAAR